MTLLLRICCLLVGIPYHWGRRPSIDTKAWRKAVKPPRYRAPDFVEDVDPKLLEDPELEFTNTHYAHVISFFNRCLAQPAASKVEGCLPE